MGIPDLFALVALVLALYDVIQTRGRSATAWAVVLLCAAYLWHLR